MKERKEMMMNGSPLATTTGSPSQTSTSSSLSTGNVVKDTELKKKKK
jgi:hypothetical protein